MRIPSISHGSAARRQRLSARIRDPDTADIAPAGHLWLHHREPGFDQLSNDLSRNTARSQEPFLPTSWRLSERPENATMVLGGESHRSTMRDGSLRGRQLEAANHSGDLQDIRAFPAVRNLLPIAEAGLGQHPATVLRRAR